MGSSKHLFREMMAVNPSSRYPEIWSKTVVLQFDSDFLEKMDLFSATMSHGTEDKQVVSLLEYGLNYVSSFICLVIGHTFPLSNSGVAPHAVCDVPLEVKAGEIQHRNVLLFFPSTFSWVTELFLSSSCTVVYYVSGLFWLAAGWDVPLESSSGGTDLGLFQYCYFHRRQGSGWFTPPIWSRTSLHGGRRKQLHASNVVKSHLLDSLVWKWKKKKSNLTYYMENVSCFLFFFIIKRSDLELFRQRATSSRHRCNYSKLYMAHSSSNTRASYPSSSIRVTLPLIKEQEVFR